MATQGSGGHHTALSRQALASSRTFNLIQNIMLYCWCVSIFTYTMTLCAEGLSPEWADFLYERQVTDADVDFVSDAVVFGVHSHDHLLCCFIEDLSRQTPDWEPSTLNSSNTSLKNHCKCHQSGQIKILEYWMNVGYIYRVKSISQCPFLTLILSLFWNHTCPLEVTQRDLVSLEVKMVMLKRRGKMAETELVSKQFFMQLKPGGLDVDQTELLSPSASQWGLQVRSKPGHVPELRGLHSWPPGSPCSLQWKTSALDW